MPPWPTRGPIKRPGRVWAPKRPRTPDMHTYWVSSLARMPRSWAWKGPGHGGRAACCPDDYVLRAPGARRTPHVGGGRWARYVPSFPTIALEGGLATLCGQPRPIALEQCETAKSRLFWLFRPFPAFRWIQAALAYCPDRFVRHGRNTRKTLVYGFPHPRDTLGTPWIPWIQGSPSPYSWPPELARLGQFRILGLHTAQKRKSAGSRVF